MATKVEPVLLSEPFRPHTPEYLADPYRGLAALRALGPCVVDPGSGRWFLLGYEHVSAGLSQIVRGTPSGPDRRVHFPANPFAADGPEHQGPRRLLAPSFTNRSVKRFEQRARSIVDAVLDTKADGDGLRLCDELGFVLPYTLTCEMLGVPDVSIRDDLRTWTWKCQQLLDPFLDDARLADCMAASGELAGHLHDVLVWKRDHLDDDLLSMVLRASDDGSVLRPEQVLSYVHTLYLAGMHTTINQVALSVLALLRNPAQWELLRSDRSLLENAVEEVLRFEPTAQFMRRATDHEVEICDVTIPAGVDVLCWIASANRDPEHWGPDADVLDIRRPDARQHVAFGFGPHVCMGAWLARLELQIVIGSLLDRFPHSTLPDQQIDWESVVLRGPSELIVELHR